MSNSWTLTQALKWCYACWMRVITQHNQGMRCRNDDPNMRRRGSEVKRGSGVEW